MKWADAQLVIEQHAVALKMASRARRREERADWDFLGDVAVTAAAVAKTRFAPAMMEAVERRDLLQLLAALMPGPGTILDSSHREGLAWVDDISWGREGDTSAFFKFFTDGQSRNTPYFYHYKLEWDAQLLPYDESFTAREGALDFHTVLDEFNALPKVGGASSSHEPRSLEWTFRAFAANPTWNFALSPYDVDNPVYRVPRMTGSFSYLGYWERWRMVIGMQPWFAWLHEDLMVDYGKFAARVLQEWTPL